jgi:hypothetical protein
LTENAIQSKIFGMFINSNRLIAEMNQAVYVLCGLCAKSITIKKADKIRKARLPAVRPAARIKMEVIL